MRRYTAVRQSGTKYSLNSCKADTSGLTKFVVMHYPPVNDRHDDSEILRIIRDNDIDYMVYGHLHGEESFSYVFEGMHDGTSFLILCPAIISILSLKKYVTDIRRNLKWKTS